MIHSIKIQSRIKNQEPTHRQTTNENKTSRSSTSITMISFLLLASRVETFKFIVIRVSQTFKSFKSRGDMKFHKKEKHDLCRNLFCFLLTPWLCDQLAFPTACGFIPATTNGERLQKSQGSLHLVGDTMKKSADMVSIEPLLMNVLIEDSSSSLGVGGIVSASHGISIWRSSLSMGRLPTEIDFSSSNVWPAEPLFTELSKAMVSLQLPRFVLRHPETVSAVLISLLRLTIEFTKKLDVQKEEILREDSEDADDDDYDDLFLSHDYDFEIHFDSESTEAEDQFLSSEDSDNLAQSIANNLIQEWNGVISGVNALHKLFGCDHGLLNLNEENGSGAIDGFGLQDGIWTHTGWQEIPQLQKQISDMPELRDLLKELGRRPTAENGDRFNKFSTRKLQRDGGIGAQFDPQMRESVSGITLSNNLTEMLPSEAVLLRGSSPALRRLFMAKKAESKLLSYQMSGWTDVPSVPLTRPLYQQRMPSAPGGPIIVCLDTSWSMSGMREQLSKSVVLSCVSAAHKQGRECQVVAFSTERGTMEAGIITPDVLGIQRLLNFLSHSFGGGTDVTGALKFAMATLDSDIMRAADILMITDGEIPDPPVSDEIMEALDRLKLQQGVEVHGLLVGKSESRPLTRLCTNTHDFLLGYDTLAIIDSARFGSSTSLASMNSSRRERERFFGFSRYYGRRRMEIALYAKKSKYDGGSYGQNRKKGRKNQGWEDEENGDYVLQERWDPEDDEDDDGDNDVGSSANEKAYLGAVDLALESLRTAVNEHLEAQRWLPEELEEEKHRGDSCYTYQKELKAAVERVGEGLIERQSESSLVVLAMLANEHVLLLGVPGTGKSVLGRRLAKLCNGSFFQRLLTRFTTPEELFGPLSLRSLENDEYRRCTGGFLPTASVAFLDEIFKANSAILNTLLTILNERKFDNAGGQEACPIRCVVGASNELPESDELVALYDRFLIRKEVLPVSNDGVIQLLSMSNPGYSSCDNPVAEASCDVIFAEGLDKVVTALSAAADSVHIGDDACELMKDLRTYMREEQNVEISDRRLVKTSRLLKIGAASQGRSRVDPIDCMLLQHCMWQLPEQKAAVRDWLWDNLTPVDGSLEQFRLLLDTLREEIMTAVRKTSGDVTGEQGGREMDVEVIKSLRIETSRIATILQQRHAEIARHIELLRHSEDYLWIERNEAQAMKQLLLPRAETVSVEVRRALADACALEMSLTDSPEAPSNDLRLAVIAQLWEKGYSPDSSFSEDELSIGMREAKAKYDLETFRKWKRARKKAQE